MDPEKPHDPKPRTEEEPPPPTRRDAPRARRGKPDRAVVQRPPSKRPGDPPRAH